MSEEKSWKTWKEKWKFTNQNAEDIVKEIFRLGGTQPVNKTYIDKFIPPRADGEDGLDFAIELGWLKDCLNETYKVTACGLMMLSHRIKG